MRSKGWGPDLIGLALLSEKTPEPSSSLSFCHVRTQREGSSLQAKKIPHQTPTLLDPAGGLPASRTMRK